MTPPLSPPGKCCKGSCKKMLLAQMLSQKKRKPAYPNTENSKQRWGKWRRKSKYCLKTSFRKIFCKKLFRTQKLASITFISFQFLSLFDYMTLDLLFTLEQQNKNIDRVIFHPILLLSSATIIVNFFQTKKSLCLSNINTVNINSIRNKN